MRQVYVRQILTECLLVFCSYLTLTFDWLTRNGRDCSKGSVSYGIYGARWYQMNELTESTRSKSSGWRTGSPPSRCSCSKANSTLQPSSSSTLRARLVLMVNGNSQVPCCLNQLLSVTQASGSWCSWKRALLSRVRRYTFQQQELPIPFTCIASLILFELTSLFRQWSKDVIMIWCSGGQVKSNGCSRLDSVYKIAFPLTMFVPTFSETWINIWTTLFLFPWCVILLRIELNLLLVFRNSSEVAT